MSRFLFGMITGAVLLFVAMHYHVVRGSEGVVLVPKISNNLSDVYVDTREFGLDDWQNHKPLAASDHAKQSFPLTGRFIFDQFSRFNERHRRRVIHQKLDAVNIARDALEGSRPRDLG